MLHQYLAGRPFVAQAEVWVNIRDRLVPSQLAFVDEQCQQQSGHPLRSSETCRYEQGVGVDFLGLADLFNSQPAFERRRYRRRSG